MIDYLLRLIATEIVGKVIRFILFPAVLLLATPFIFLRAALIAWRDADDFWPLVADGYYSVDVWWWI